MKKVYLIFTAITLHSASANAQIINTIAGQYNGNGATATAISINPINQVVDSVGNIYFPDPEKHVVRKLSNKGVYSVFAGNTISGSSGDGGLATQAQLKSPYSIAMDASGDMYICDSYDARIRKVDTHGKITTIAGNGIVGFSGDGGKATSAEFNGVNSVAVDAIGNIYVADFQNRRVRKIDTSGIINTVVGDGTYGNSGDGGLASAAKLGYPLGVAVNPSGELFICDVAYNQLRKVSTEGVISLVAGNGNIGFSGDGGLATAAEFFSLQGVAFDKVGDIFIADGNNNRIREINTSGIVTTVVGNGTAGFSGDGGLAKNAELLNPTGVTFDNNSNLLIASGFRLRVVNSSNIISTLAGNGSGGYNGEGVAASASQLYTPDCIITDSLQNIYVTNEQDYRIRKIDPNGIITTVAGNGTRGIGENGVLATSSFIGFVDAITVDKDGNLLFGDISSSTIRKINGNGVINAIAGNGTRGFSGDGGLATLAEFGDPNSILADKAGNIYFTDQDNVRIRKITTDGIINTIVGNGTPGYAVDSGMAINAELNYVGGLAIDNSGNLYIADASNSRIRKVTPAGIITTIAGNGIAGYSGDGGLATNCEINYPLGIAIDDSGNILFSDGGNNVIREINLNGIISTVAGTGSTYGDGGKAIAAELTGVTSITIDRFANIYLNDITNDRIRKISNSNLPVQLLSFTATRENTNTYLQWQTLNELNSNYFNIQRGIDGINFTTIGQTNARGNTNSQNDYSYTDASASMLNATIVYYRLSEVDKNNAVTLSKIVKVNYNQQDNGIKLSPIPAIDFINLSVNNLSGKASITIYDVKGTQVQLISKALENGSIIHLNLSGLAKGSYYMQVLINGVSYHETFIKE